ncbi:MAG: DNA starvation/stationary phase protection protein Dps [Phycisphaerales bacterium]|nr:DNA starvation/stationary phase protection protein Dps [Phycisphaerales bacterium]
MHATLNDLPAESRTNLCALLNARLADTIDLTSMAKQAHWNVKGPQFIGLHKMFDELWDDLNDWVDLIAERIVQLGGTANGTVRDAAEASNLEEYPHGAVTCKDHVAAVAQRLSVVGRTIRAAIGSSEDLGDADTADLFTEVSRGLDKWLWFVEAHQQAES